HAPAKVDEFLVGVGLEAVAEGLQVGTQLASQFRPTRLLVNKLRGVGPDGQHRGTDGQRLTIAVGDLTPVGGNGHVAHAALVALILQEALVQYMQLDDAPADRDAAYSERTDDQPESPGM